MDYKEWEERFYKGELSKDEEDWYAFARSVCQVASISPHEVLMKSKPKIYNAEYIKRLMEDVGKNAKELQRIGEDMAIKNGILKEFIMYKSNQLLYYHFLIPKNMMDYSSKKELEKAEYDACVQFDKFKYSYNASWIMKRVITIGELFLYFDEWNNCYNIFEMPSPMCRVTHFQDGMLRYSIDMNAINEGNLTYFPKQIQSLYKRFVKGTLGNLEDDVWYPLGDHAYALSLNHNGGGIPYYTDIFLELCRLEDLKDVDELNAYLSATRLLVQKIPTDDTGKPTMPRPMVSAYHNAFKRAVPDTANTLTTPMDVESVSLGVSKTQTVTYVENGKDVVYSMAGINDEVFNGSKSSNEAIILSNSADSILGRVLLRQIEMMFNCEMKFNSATKNWSLHAMETTDYTKNNERNALLSALSTYAVKHQHLALWGYTPLEAFNVIRFEHMMQMEEYMYPMGTAYTQSGNEGGRPSNSETTDTVGQSSEGENN